MGPEEGNAWLKERGLTLAAAKGGIPVLAEAIAGGPIRGS